MTNTKFNLNKYLKDLEYLVNIDSGSYNPEGVEKVAQFFYNKYKELGWSVQKNDVGDEVGPCLVITNNESESYDILLVGHMDTVFKAGTVKQRPFTIKNDIAYGPGVIDMKSGLLSLYYAAEAITKEAIENHTSICIVLNSDEEIGSRYSAPIIEECALKSKVAYILEPARKNGALVLERKGIGAYDIEFQGIASHAGVEPEKGASAIAEMGHCIVELNKLTDYDIGTTVNVGIANGGTGRNVVASNANIQVDLRFKSEDEHIRVDKAIENLANFPKIHGVKIIVNNLGSRPPMNPSSSTEQLWKVIENIGDEIGIQLKWVATGGGSDANLTSALGVDSIDGLGPIGGGSHGVDEYLEINSIEPRYELLKRIITDNRIKEVINNINKDLPSTSLT